MFSYLLVLVAVLSRVIPHPWLSFTAVGGSLLYFGARRPLRQMLFPVALLMATDYYQTVFAYGYDFKVQHYLTTWAWYAAVVILGRILLRQQASFQRVVGGALLSSTSFFVVSNFSVWMTSLQMYPRTPAGLAECYAVALPFYRNDVLSTLLVCGVVFGLPALLRQRAEAAEHHFPV